MNEATIGERAESQPSSFQGTAAVTGSRWVLSLSGWASNTSPIHHGRNGCPVLLRRGQAPYSISQRGCAACWRRDATMGRLREVSESRCRYTGAASDAFVTRPGV